MLVVCTVFNLFYTSDQQLCSCSASLILQSLPLEVSEQLKMVCLILFEDKRIQQQSRFPGTGLMTTHASCIPLENLITEAEIANYLHTQVSSEFTQVPVPDL